MHSVISSALVVRVAAVVLAAMSACAVAQIPAEYPSNYRQIIARANVEGKLRVYSTTDVPAAAPLLKEFEALFPQIKVEYTKLNSPELHNRFLSESAANGHSADILWSSAMELQMKLANDGYAAVYKSPEAPYLPPWAVWRDEAFGTTFEPAVFVYNTRALGGDDIPQTHADFIRVLKAKPEKFLGNVTAYDIEKAAVGFLLMTQDSQAMPMFWTLAQALGAANVELEANTSTMLERIASGKQILGYDLLGSYAMARAKHDPSLGVVLPKDYTLVLSRVMLIAKNALNPNAARLWVDFLLSKRGQTIIAERSQLFSVRPDVTGEFTAASLVRTLGASAKPIAVGPGLLVHLDYVKRQEFIKRWRNAMTKTK